VSENESWVNSLVDEDGLLFASMVAIQNIQFNACNNFLFSIVFFLFYSFFLFSIIENNKLHAKKYKTSCSDSTFDEEKILTLT
jgi:hypothetical protein